MIMTVIRVNINDSSMCVIIHIICVIITSRTLLGQKAASDALISMLIYVHIYIYRHTYYICIAV